MKKKECPGCAMMVDASAKICPVCQFEFPHRNPIYAWGAILLAVLFLLLMVL